MVASWTVVYLLLQSGGQPFISQVLVNLNPTLVFLPYLWALGYCFPYAVLLRGSGWHSAASYCSDHSFWASFQSTSPWLSDLLWVLWFPSSSESIDFSIWYDVYYSLSILCYPLQIRQNLLGLLIHRTWTTAESHAWYAFCSCFLSLVW